MTDTYKGHYLRRWSIMPDGRIGDGLEHDAIDTRLHTPEIVAAVTAYNGTLRHVANDIAAYQSALLVPETIAATDDEGNPVIIPHPDYEAAQAVIADTSAEVLALIGEDEEAKAAAIEALRSQAPVFEVVTDGPALHPLKAWQFWALVDATDGLRDAIYAAIEAIENPLERAAVKNRFERTDQYDRSDPLFANLAAAVGLTDAQIDAMWMQAVALGNP